MAVTNPGGAVDTSSLVTLTPATSIRNVVAPAADPAVVPLVLKSVVAQTADLQQWQDSAGAVKAMVAPDGKMDVFNLVGTYITGPFFKVRGDLATTDIGEVPRGAGATLNVSPHNAAIVGLVVRGFTGQTADLTRWADENGAIMSRVSNLGELRVDVAGRGIVLKSPDGLVTRRISIDNAGAIVATAV